jgi:hypothetical protein
MYLPVVRLHVLIYDKLVVAFGGEVERGCDDADGRQNEDRPRGGDEMEARVEVPAVPKVGVVVVEEGLLVLVSASHAGDRRDLPQ